MLGRGGSQSLRTLAVPEAWSAPVRPISCLHAFISASGNVRKCPETQFPEFFGVFGNVRKCLETHFPEEDCFPCQRKTIGPTRSYRTLRVGTDSFRP